MTTDETFEDQVPSRLAGLGEVTARSMFGGHGLYWRGSSSPSFMPTGST
jgi:TfoX/Sxy family transcriptional regulator of competence genes